jgi:hypothetical protein
MYLVRLKVQSWQHHHQARLLKNCNFKRLSYESVQNGFQFSNTVYQCHKQSYNFEWLGKLALNSNHIKLLSSENYVTRNVSLHHKRVCNLLLYTTIHEGI